MAVSLRPAVFLDKDGTLLDDVPYNVDPARMQLAPGAPEALRALSQLDWPLIVVSNQAGVALGKFPIDALSGVHERLQQLMLTHHALLAGFYFCPHHPQGQVAAYSRVCWCRKPMPGMLMKAAAQWGIALTSSWMVGDILDDIEAGRRVGCKTVLIDNGNETEWRLNSEMRRPDHVVPDLAAAAALIVASTRALSVELGDD